MQLRVTTAHEELPFHQFTRSHPPLAFDDIITKMLSESVHVTKAVAVRTGRFTFLYEDAARPTQFRKGRHEKP